MDIEAMRARRRLFDGSLFRGVVEPKPETEFPGVKIEIVDNEDIDLGNGLSATVLVDPAAIEHHVNNLLIPPVAADFPTAWSYVFDAKPRPLPGTPEEAVMKRVLGFVLFERSAVIVCVPTIWDALPGDKKTAAGLKEEICKTIVHENRHLGFDSNLETRAAQGKTGMMRGVWQGGGYLLPVLAGIWGGARGAARGDLNREMTRRDFIRLTGSVAFGFVAGSFVGSVMGPEAKNLYNTRIDPWHSQCYQEEKNWEVLKDFVHVEIT